MAEGTNDFLKRFFFANGTFRQFLKGLIKRMGRIIENLCRRMCVHARYAGNGQRYGHGTCSSISRDRRRYVQLDGSLDTWQRTSRKRCVRIKIPGVISRINHIPRCLFHLGWAACSTIYSDSNIFTVVSDGRRTACCLNRRVITSAEAEADH